MVRPRRSFLPSFPLMRRGRYCLKVLEKTMEAILFVATSSFLDKERSYEVFQQHFRCVCDRGTVR